MTVQFQLDRDVSALSIERWPGRAARTVGLTATVYADIDAKDTPLGIEFVNAEEFVPFLREHAGDAGIPPPVRALFRVTVA